VPDSGNLLMIALSVANNQYSKYNNRVCR